MDAAQKQRDAEALVHMSFGRAYATALDAQSSRDTPQHRKQAAAAIVAERAATASRDAAAINRRDAVAGRSAMEQAYGTRAADVSAVLSGRIAEYDLPKSFEGTKDLSALVLKAQVLVSQANVETYTSRGYATPIGPGGNYLALIGDRAAETKEKLIAHTLHVKSAIDSAVDRRAIDRSQGDMLYQRFQNAAFDLGAARHHDQNYAAFERKNTPAVREEVAREVEARYQAQSKTIERAKQSETDPTNAARAEAFRSLPPGEAAKKYPELAGAIMMLQAMDKKALADGYAEKPRAAILAHAKQKIAAGIEKGNLPEGKLREDRAPVRDQSLER